jgi:hypothetical protein
VPIRNWKAPAILLCTLALAGCAATPNPGSDSGGFIRQRNEGYALLYQLMGDESRVGQIFVLKQADNSIHDLVTQIGSYCQSAKKQMDQFPHSDPQIEFDLTDLPKMERKSRDLEQMDDTKALLTSSGKTFELRLLFTQAQAMGYATQLAAALNEQENDKTRKDFLKNLSKRCDEFHDQLMNHLAAQP